MDDNTSDNALDIAATLNNVLDSSDHSKTASVKSPESGSQSALVDSLTQVFTTSKVTSPAIEGKIAELIDNMLIGDYRPKRSRKEWRNIHRQKTANSWP